MTSGDWILDYLLAGRFPFGQERTALLAGAVADAMDTDGIGLEPRIGEMLDLFDRSAEARMLMTCARRAGIPYSEARERWSSPEDVAAEFAFSGLEAAEHMAQCPQCGIDPEDVLDQETFRPLPFGRWKLYKTTCWVCGEMRRARATLDDTEKEDGTDYRILPRDLGDPWRDEGDRDRD